MDEIIQRLEWIREELKHFAIGDGSIWATHPLHGTANSIADLEKQLRLYAVELRRWEWVQEHCVRAVNLHMDGTSEYTFGGRLPRAKYVGTAIDMRRQKQ